MVKKASQKSESRSFEQAVDDIDEMEGQKDDDASEIAPQKEEKLKYKILTDQAIIDGVEYEEGEIVELDPVYAAKLMSGDVRLHQMSSEEQREAEEKNGNRRKPR